MNFGQALEALKSGQRVSRFGWNGRGMWLVLARGSEVFDITGEKTETITATVLVNTSDPPFTAKIRPCIVMHDAQGMLVPGWLASQTDLLAEDWVVVIANDDGESALA